MSDPTVIPYPFDFAGGVGFPLAEDAALKAKFAGMAIAGPKGAPVPVSVWYRMPDPETTLKYPFVVIDLLSINQATDQTHSEYDERSIDREHRRAGSAPSAEVWPSMTANLRRQFNVPDGVAVQWTRFVPFYLMYQVATHARSYAHHMALFNRLIQPDMLPYRWGFLDVPADQTRRRLDNMGHRAANDIDRESPGANKRIFRNIFTVRTLGWVPEFAANLIPVAREVVIDLHES